MNRAKHAVGDSVELCPPLPVEPTHWQAIIHAMQLSPRQAKLVELLLRGMSDKRIAVVMQISEPTIRTYLDRIWRRTRTRGRMELAMRVLTVSRELDRAAYSPQE